MADSNAFTVNLVTPERILLTGLATEVILRTGEGDVTFLAGHTPLVGTVEPGVVRVVRSEGERTGWPSTAVSSRWRQVCSVEGGASRSVRGPGSPC